MNRFGVEIEAIFNRDLLPKFVVGQYHDNEHFGEQIPKWNITFDRTVTPIDSKFINPIIHGELVTGIVTKDTLKDSLDSLKAYCQKQKGCKGKELHEFMEFPRTCGCHVHFSTPMGSENQMISMSLYKKLRNITFNRVRKELPQIYAKFKMQYFRAMAQEQKGAMIDKGLRGEFNYTALHKGIEWRSFNLRGVTTWEELYQVFDIGITEVDNILEEYTSNKGREEFLPVITDEEIQRFTDRIKVIYPRGRK